MKKIIIAIIGIAIYLIQYKQVFASPPVGNYLQLNGGYVKANSDLNYSPSAFSVEAWIRSNELTGIQKVLSVGSKNTNQFRYEFGLNGGSLFLNYRSGNSFQTYISTGSLLSSVWTHIGAVISPTGTRMYINGYQVYSGIGAVSLPPVADTIVLGGSFQENSWSPYAFHGELDEVRISTADRNIEELWKNGIYTLSLPSDQSTLILWHMDGVRGETISIDSSSNSFIGTLIGGDSVIHYYGVEPTPTPYTFPVIRWERPVMPTIGLPISRITPISAFPTQSSLPISVSTPTPSARDYSRMNREFRM